MSLRERRARLRYLEENPTELSDLIDKKKDLGLKDPRDDPDEAKVVAPPRVPILLQGLFVLGGEWQMGVIAAVMIIVPVSTFVLYTEESEYVGVVVALTFTSLLCLVVCCGTDPGVVPCEPVKERDSKEYKPELLPSKEGILKLCSTCNIYRKPATHHCDICNVCIDNFDHHCDWIGKCVAHRNLRSFHVFVIVTIMVAALVAWQSGLQCVQIVATRRNLRFSKLFMSMLPCLPLMLYALVVTLLLTWLWLYQARNITCGITTKQAMKGGVDRISLRPGQSRYQLGSLQAVCTRWWYALGSSRAPSKLIA